MDYEAISFEEVTALAQSGDADAQFELACRLIDGIGCEIQEAEGLRWFIAAAEQGDTYAMFNLSILYGQGTGCEADEEISFGWMEKAANAGHVRAHVNVAARLLSGNGCRQDIEAGIYHMIAAAQGEDVDAMYRLATLYNAPAFGHVDLEKRFYWLQQAANHSHEDAKYELGLALLFGEGCEKDAVAAVEALTESAKMDNGRAANLLGKLYLSGTEIPQDENLAVFYLRQGAQHGIAEAQSNYGVALQNGLGGIEKDDVQAVEWFRKAAARENDTAQLNLALALAAGRGVERNLTSAEYWLQRASQNGNTTAAHILKNGLILEQ